MEAVLTTLVCITVVNSVWALVHSYQIAKLNAAQKAKENRPQRLILPTINVTPPPPAYTQQ